MLCLLSCGIFEPVQRGTNEPVAVWYALDVDIVKVGLYVIVKVFSIVGSFRHFIGLLLNGPDGEDDYEIEILKQSKQINHNFVVPDVDDLALLRKVTYTVIQILSPPSSAAATKRLANMLKLYIILARYGI